MITSVITPLSALGYDATLPELVGAQARRNPDGTFLQGTDGRPGVTFAEAHDRALRWAGALRAAGVGPGDRVVTMLDNCVEGPLFWLALSHLGATEVSVSTRYRGLLLTHALNLSAARLVFADVDVLDALSTVAPDLTFLEEVVVRTDDELAATALPWKARSLTEALEHGVPMEPGEPPRPHDIASVIFTSGTTGPSKGVLITWRALGVGAAANTGMTAEDVIYHTSPANHVVSRVLLVVAAHLGCHNVMKASFRTEDFWPDIDRYRCTYASLVGVMPEFLMSQPERPDDADHTLKTAAMTPVYPEYRKLMKRFGIEDLSTAYGMTEVLGPVRSGWDIDDPRSCGRLRAGWPHFEFRLVDDDDHEVPVGQAGQFRVRTSEPWAITPGYLGMPEATAAAWRNGWFHTGDILRIDAEGRFFYVDRAKDAIRRRGENVSSFEVEAEVSRFPLVAECAAIGVADDGGSEQEIKIFVVPTDGATLDPAELITFLAGRITAYMVPRYVEIVPQLPRTAATLRVEKYVLRQRPAGPTFDAREAGIGVPKR